MIFVFPVVLLAFHRLVDRPTAARGAVLGLALALAALACGYYGIFAGLAVAWGALWYLPGRMRSPGYWLALLTAVVVAAAVVGPVLVPYLELRSETGARQAINFSEMIEYSADWKAYLTSPAHAHAWLIALVGKGREVLFPGLVLTCGVFLLLFRVVRAGSHAVPDRQAVGFYATLAGIACWASFGPDAGLYRWLGESLPFMSFLRAPARLGVLVVFAMAVLAGCGLAAILPTRRRALVAAALTLVTAVEVSAAPWPLRPVPPVSEAHRMLAELPRGAVVEFQFPYQPAGLHEHARYMFRSMWHWQPLVNGYSDYIPPDFRQIAVPINGFPDPVSFRILKERQVRYVTIDLESYDPEAREVLFARFPPYRKYLRPLVETGDIWLYEIVEYPPDLPDAR